MRLAGLVSLAVVAFGVVVAWWYDAALSWDGAYYLFKVLDLQEPFVPINRGINVPLQVPVLLASRSTSDLSALRRVFVLPYVAIPLVGLALSWWVVGSRRPDLFVWPVLAICLFSLPGQFFFTSEGPIATALFWPVLLALLLGPRPWDVPLVVLLSAAVWSAHPIAIGLFLLAAAVLAWQALRHPRRLPLAALSVAFVAAAIGRALVPLSGYETEALSFARLLDSYRVSVAGRPLAALLCAALAGAFVFAVPLARGRLGARWVAAAVHVVPAALAVAAGVLLVPLVRDYGHWAHQLDFRFWQGILGAGVMLVASAEVLGRPIPSSSAAAGQGRAALVLASALSFALVLGFQARSWQHASDQLAESVSALPPGCAPLDSLDWLHGTPLDHWATVPYAVVLQGRAPGRILLDADGCQTWRASGDFPIGTWDVRPANSGWFRLPRP